MAKSSDLYFYLHFYILVLIITNKICFLIIISEIENIYNYILQGGTAKTSDLYNSLNNCQYYCTQYIPLMNINEQSVNILYQHYGVNCQNIWTIPSNGKHNF